MDRAALERLHEQLASWNAASTPEIMGLIELMRELLEVLLAPSPREIMTSRTVVRDMCAHDSCRPLHVEAWAGTGGPTWPCRR